MSFKSKLHAIKRETNWVRIIIFIIFSIYALSMIYAIFSILIPPPATPLQNRNHQEVALNVGYRCI